MNEFQLRVIEAKIETLTSIFQSLQALGLSERESSKLTDFLFNIPNDKYKTLPIIYQEIIKNAYENLPVDFKKFLYFYGFLPTF